MLLAAPIFPWCREARLSREHDRYSERDTHRGSRFMRCVTEPGSLEALIEVNYGDGTVKITLRSWTLPQPWRYHRRGY